MWLLLSPAERAPGPTPFPVGGAAPICRATAMPAPSAAGPSPAVRGASSLGAASSSTVWGYSVQTLLSLFTAFTLVQLRSLLRSKCWQAVFINRVRLNVFKCMYLRKKKTTMLLFCFRLVLDLGFWLCFPWLTHSGAKDSVLSAYWCFRLRPVFWGGECTRRVGTGPLRGPSCCRHVREDGPMKKTAPSNSEWD